MARDWTTKEGCRADIIPRYGYVVLDALAGLDHEWLAEIAYAQEDDHAALGHLIDAVYEIGRAAYFSAVEYDIYEPPYGVVYYLDNYAGVTWQQIVEAWVKDDFAGRAWTIGVIDRMRQILWDEPFDLTWAARPEDKEIET